MCDLSEATGLLIICTCLRKRTSATHDKLKPSVVKVENRSWFCLHCQHGVQRQPQGAKGLTGPCFEHSAKRRISAQWQRTVPDISHVDQIISAFEQITAQQPHPKPAAAEGGDQSSNAVWRFSNACMLSHPACASPLLSACVKAVGTIIFLEASQDPAKHSKPIVQPVEASTCCTAHRRQAVEVSKGYQQHGSSPLSY